MAYHLVHRLRDGRRSVAAFETREKAEAHRNALIAKDPRSADDLVILDDQAVEKEAAED